MLTSVVTIIRLAASASLPPIDLTMIKLAVAVGLANIKNNAPSITPSKPIEIAASVTPMGSSAVFMTTAKTVTRDESLIALRFIPAPVPSNASGKARLPKYSPADINVRGTGTCSAETSIARAMAMISGFLTISTITCLSEKDLTTGVK